MFKQLYAVIDLKSFYASCECALRGLDIFSTPLVVCDPNRGNNTIVMSATPYLKSNFRIPNVCRRKDLPAVKEMIFAQPRMATYIDMSSKVVSIFLDFVSEEDLHVYSIDESFLNIAPYLKQAKATPEEFVAKIQKRIKDELGLIATAGIGPNMFMAKVCLDNEGKKKPPYIGHWEMEDVKKKLWAISPITNIWGISTGMENRLRNMGIRSLKSLAEASLEDLETQFGVMGKQLHDLANGIDNSNIREKYVPKDCNLSIGQSLHRDYSPVEARLLILEMNDDLCFRLRLSGQKAGKVAIFVGYSAECSGGFSHQCALDYPSDDNDTLYKALIGIYDRYIENKAIRNIGLSFGKLAVYSYDGFSVFENPGQTIKKQKLNRAIDKIKMTYGKDSCLRLSSLSKASTAKERHQQIGGHKA